MEGLGCPQHAVYAHARSLTPAHGSALCDVLCDAATNGYEKIKAVLE